MFNVVLDFGQDFLWNSGYFSSILSWNDVQWFGGDLGFISLCEVVYTAPLGQLANSPVVARKGAAEEMAGPDHYWHWLQTGMVLTYLWQSESHSWDHFLYLARSKLRLCSANHRPGYWSNLACDWPSTVWAYSEQETRKRALMYAI